MSQENGNWRDLALEVYRLATSEILERWSEPRRDDVRFYIEELREALLDLKEATIANQEVRALQHIDEVMLLLAELRLRSQDE